MAVRSSSEHLDFATLLRVHKSSCNRRCLISIECSRCIHVSKKVHRAQLISAIITHQTNWRQMNDWDLVIQINELTSNCDVPCSPLNKWRSMVAINSTNWSSRNMPHHLRRNESRNNPILEKIKRCNGYIRVAFYMELAHTLNRVLNH